MKPIEESLFELPFKPLAKKPSPKHNSSSTLASDLAEPQNDFVESISSHFESERGVKSTWTIEEDRALYEIVQKSAAAPFASG
jgi:hypothetical protein